QAPDGGYELGLRSVNPSGRGGELRVKILTIVADAWCCRLRGRSGCPQRHGRGCKPRNHEGHEAIQPKQPDLVAFAPSWFTGVAHHLRTPLMGGSFEMPA